MSNYLNNLVLRTMDPTLVAQPRVASTFEASAFSASAPQAPATESSNAEQSPAITAPGPLLQESRKQVQVIHTQTEIREVAHSSNARNEGSSQPVWQRKDVPALPVAEPRAEVHTQNQITPGTAPNVQRPATKEVIEIRRQPVPIEPRIVHDAANDGESLWRKFRPRVRNVVKDELSLGSALQEEAGDGQPVIHPPTETIARPATVAIAPVLPPQPVVTTDRQPVAAPAPEITVTIGRVDVRAVVTSHTPPARIDTRPLTTPSLDQYLKERSEGRR
jgi:hypothetical protein